MSVIGTAVEIPGREDTRGQNNMRGYRRRFQVYTDSRYDDGNIVRSAPGLPSMYDPYITSTSNDLGSLVVNVSPRQHPQNRQLWVVDVEYSTEYDRIDNPFTEPPEITYGSETFQEPLPGMPLPAFTVDTSADLSSDLNKQNPVPNPSLLAFGRGILNSAGSPCQPQPERTSSRPVITFTKNQSSFTAAYKIKWENTVNQSPWNGLQYRQALLRTVDAQSHIYKSPQFNVADIPYYRVTWVFVLKAETWDFQLLDYGPYYLKWTGSGVSGGETPDKVPFTTADGTPRMGLLDHSNPNRPGSKLADNADPQYNRYPGYREENFSALGIDLNLGLAALKTPSVRSSDLRVA